jgi:hypothetical protein
MHTQLKIDFFSFTFLNTYVFTTYYVIITQVSRFDSFKSSKRTSRSTRFDTGAQIC